MDNSKLIYTYISKVGILKSNKLSKNVNSAEWYYFSNSTKIQKRKPVISVIYR